jgi:beta-glucosidase
VIHNELLAHGEALKRIRSVSPGSQAGITLSITPVHPFSERPRDRKAALLANQFMNHIAVGPLLDGEYPAELWKRAFLLRPRILPGDMDSISGRVDFIGLNNYQREWASWSPLTPFFNFAVSGGGGGKRGVLPTDAEFTAMGWEVWPQSIGEAITLLRSHRPDLVIVVTETGIALEDEVVGGVVDDPRRIRFLERSFAEVRRAMSGGADVRGIFVWSFMDNFEWAEGTRPRFGLVHVDFKSLERRPKASAAWYARVIREGGYEMGEAGA